MLFDFEILTWVSLAFLAAGAVKGTLGLGLPALVLGTLVTVVGLQPAIAILLIPALATNLWQALGGGHARAILRRIWPFLVTTTLAVQLGAAALTRVPVSLLSALLGILLAAYGVLGLCRPHWRLAPRLVTRVGIAAGFANGVLGGMTGAFAVPGVPYLQSLALPRDHLVQAMGMLFLASTVSLGAGLGHQRLLTADLAAVSALAVLPALAGMSLGRSVRRRIPEDRFRRVFLTALVVLGSYIVFRNLATG